MPAFQPPDDDELREAAQLCADTYAKICNERFVGCNISIPIPVHFALADTDPKCAGMAYADRRIGLNMVLYRDHPAVILNEVIPHEIAHVASCQIFDRHGASGLTDHGPEWQEIMRQLGKKPLKYHQLDTRKAVQHFKSLKKSKKLRLTPGETKDDLT